MQRFVLREMKSREPELSSIKLLPLHNQFGSTAGAACGEGAVFEVRRGSDGQPLPFVEAYPGALSVLKRLAPPPKADSEYKTAPLAE